MPKELTLGTKALIFSLPNETGATINLSDYEKRWVVLYFYPKDNTPGCTIEALEFSTLAKNFKKEQATIFGISKDSCTSHQTFIINKKLTIQLLSDETTDIHKLYNVWKKKKFMGKSYMGCERTTYLLDPQGNIAYIWNNVKPEGHAQEVLKQLQELKTNE